MYACISVSPDNEFVIVDEKGEILTGPGEGLLLYRGGTVCDDIMFSSMSAAAICRFLGFERVESWSSGNGLKWDNQSERYEITLSEIICEGPNWLVDCTFSTSARYCNRYMDIFLSCTNGKTAGLYFF